MHGKSPTFLGALFPRLALVITLAGAGAACTGRGADSPAPDAPAATDAPAEALPQTPATSAAQPEAQPTLTVDLASLPNPVQGASGDLAASVNGEGILLGDFRAQAFSAMTYHVQNGLDPNTDSGRDQLTALRRQVLDDMINQVLISQYATTNGIKVSDKEVEESVQTHYIDELGGEDAFTKYLEEARTTRDQVAAMEQHAILGRKVIDEVVGDIPTTATHLHARHILCSTEEECAAALTRLDAGEDFATVAKDVSEDQTTAERGGDLDWIARGMLPGAKFEAALFALGPGERSGVVESEFGYHIIEVLEQDDNRELSPAQQFDLREKQLLEWLAGQRAASDVQVMVPDLADEGASQ